MFIENNRIHVRKKITYNPTFNVLFHVLSDFKHVFVFYGTFHTMPGLYVGGRDLTQVMF